jgi:hypothetical protein
VLDVALAIFDHADPSVELCHWYVNVPLVDHVPVVALTVEDAANVPETTGNTELVTLEAGTTTVAAVFAVVL